MEWLTDGQAYQRRNRAIVSRAGCGASAMNIVHTSQPYLHTKIRHVAYTEHCGTQSTENESEGERGRERE